MQYILVIGDRIRIQKVLSNNIFDLFSTSCGHINVGKDVFGESVPNANTSICDRFSSVFNLVIFR